MASLLLLELRRQCRVAARLALVSLAVCAIFYIAGKKAPADMLALMLGCSLGVVMIVPMGITRDKMEGTLDFICGLPIQPRAIAGSRFAALALLALPWAAVTGVLAGGVREVMGLDPMLVAATMWLAMIVVGACLIALMALFELEVLFGLPLLILVLSLALLPRALRSLAPGLTRDAVVRFLQRPDAPYLIAALVLAVALTAGTVAFAATERGFAHYRPRGSSR